ncbi:MAG: hypothetical protein LBJ11_05660 [Oscillospiraceae bacterium]|jgi:hypothetical protein|nr:hypothetical protein [Oscillospiraceae bacterium]
MRRTGFRRAVPWLTAGVFLFALLAGAFRPALKQWAALRFRAPDYRAAEEAPAVLCAGDYVLFGSYAGEPILWRVLALEEGRPLLFSERILCFKAFAACDPPAAASSDWSRSALRQWLGADGETVFWVGEPPDERHVYGGHNAYADEPGFLSSGNFDERQRALISGKAGEDAVFLPSRAQLQVMSARERQRGPAAAALARDDSPYLTLRRTVWYWTRDPIGTNECSVRAVTGKGTFYQDLAADGLGGVCPALRLRTGTVRAAGGDGSKGKPYWVRGE